MRIDTSVFDGPGRPLEPSHCFGIIGFNVHVLSIPHTKFQLR